jgi:hypothetical protein
MNLSGRLASAGRFLLASSGHTPVLIIALMATFLVTCPNIQLKVQHWLDGENASEDDYEEITCHACGSVHFVNQKGCWAATASSPVAFLSYRYHADRHLDRKVWLAPAALPGH